MSWLRSLPALVILGCGPAWSALPALDALQSCTQLADDSARLACFDREMAALSAVHAASGGSVTAGGVKLTPEQKIGLPPDKVAALEAPPGAAAEPELKDFSAGIRSVSVDANSRQVYVLDNGQVWRQAEFKPKFSVRPGNTVHISRGSLGSFFLSANSHYATRVSRVR